MAARSRIRIVTIFMLEHTDVYSGNVPIVV